MRERERERERERDCGRYQNRYWRETVFEGVSLVEAALEESYGKGQESLASAALRWVNHHSLMSPEHGGIVTLDTHHDDYIAGM